MKKPTHGGKRTGAGRKATPETTKRPIGTKLPPDVLEYLATVESISVAIERALRKSRGFKAWDKARSK